jgi:uncharacterized membrane protein
LVWLKLLVGAPLTALGLWLNWGGVTWLMRRQNPPPLLLKARSLVTTQRRFTAVRVAGLWLALIAFILLCLPGLKLIESGLAAGR